VPRRRVCSPPGGRSGAPPEDAGYRARGSGHRVAIGAGLSEKHDNGVDGILARATGTERLSGAELRALFEGVSLHQLGAVAHAFRFKLNPAEIVTYIVDRTINYSNVCVYRCRFCAFYRKSGGRGRLRPPLRRDREEGRRDHRRRRHRILLQGGVHPDLRLPFCEGLLRQLKMRFPAVHLHAFSAPEIHFMAKVEKMPLAEVIARVRDAGLESIPGGGAEILEDETRKRIWSRAKASTS
jgi:cyclic dehypoxanthinyl futalosine synthase